MNWSECKGKVYEACVRSCMIYGGETWDMSVENMRKSERTEMTMLGLMCAVRLQDRQVHERRLAKQIGIACIEDVVRSNRLWNVNYFLHPEDWVKKIFHI